MKANLPHREPEILDWWDRINVYRKIEEARTGADTFVLHDGPPYANGHIHLGHALNKILKDFVVKSRSMTGRRAPYVPGWDCHGLPIEHHIDKKLGSKINEMTPLQVRSLCRKHAQKFIGVQSEEFKRLGVLWDRENQSIYRTLDKTYEAEIVRQIGRFFEKGLIYQGDKPVHWCFSCKTALAEAEVEYADRTDPSVVVAFPLHGAGERIPELRDREVSIVIWTTTPWTLPANMAVTLNPEYEYVAIDVDGRSYIVAEGLQESVRESLGWGAAPVVASFSGKKLVGTGDHWSGKTITYEKPYPAKEGPAAEPGVLLLGDHVTLEAGTGCVHTAPGHGADDFQVGQAYELPLFNPVADNGTFLADKAPVDWLVGMHVFKANPRIVEDLEKRGLLLSVEQQEHSYPHCWRCRTAIIFRSTPQWFIAMDKGGLRKQAIETTRDVRWLPATGEARLAGMVESRPDWCISRQRTWGVPIPAVTCDDCFDGSTRGLITEPAFFKYLEDLFLEEGSDAWFGVPEGEGHRPYADDVERTSRLIPQTVTCPDCGSRERLHLHDHIVDVWFESGVSQAAVLGEASDLTWPADLYLEGHDQYRGWFQSSLLVAVNDRGKAPYKSVVTHGFTLDANGRKMSKSLGNTISPLDVSKQRGAEILRLWVSMIDFVEDMRLSEETLDRNAETYRKLRNTFRYLLGNLDSFDSATQSVALDELPEFDRWMLGELESLRRTITDAYEAHHYHVVYHSLHQFAGSTLSAFYLDVIKDRLYTLPRTSHARRSAQTVLHRLAIDLCRLMAPILCFTAEEIWQHLETLAGREAWSDRTVHAETFPQALVLPDAERVAARWTRLLGLREDISKALEEARAAKEIGSSLEACVTLEADEDTRTFLESFGEELRFILLTSGAVCVGPGSMPADMLRVHDSSSIEGFRIGIARAAGDKCERCWHLTEDIGRDTEWPTVCGRCVESIHEG
jgi:isoleucyl-tRNA synthetase